ncbi:DUF4435 domain-containing protein [Bacillus cereus]
MSSFPVRKNNSIFAEIKIRYSNYDLFLFIEDEKMPSIYQQIIKRLFNDTLRVGGIYSLKSKQNVLKKFEEWNKDAKELKKCFFIVDRDFDYLKEIFVPNDPNLVELNYYTLENYFICKVGALKLMQVKVHDKTEEELEQILDWENWIIKTIESFRRLFIGYAIAYKYDLRDSCSISPHKYLVKGSNDINDSQIDAYIEDVMKLSESHEEINFEEEFRLIDLLFNKDSEKYNNHALIKGKYIYTALLKHLQYITGVKFDEDFAAFILVESMDLSNLYFFKERIESSLQHNVLPTESVKSS